MLIQKNAYPYILMLDETIHIHTRARVFFWLRIQIANTFIEMMMCVPWRCYLGKITLNEWPEYWISSNGCNRTIIKWKEKNQDFRTEIADEIQTRTHIDREKKYVSNSISSLLSSISWNWSLVKRDKHYSYKKKNNKYVLFESKYTNSL